MKRFDYRERWKELLNPEIVLYLTQIHEYKGKQDLFVEAKEDVLTQLLENTKIQSIEASNKIAGINTSGERLRALVKDTTRPKTIDEQEIAGYRDVLNMIQENYDYIPPKSSIILQLHRDMFKFEGFDVGGKYRAAGNTAGIVEELCKAFDEAIATQQIDSLILIPMFILDFSCVHPFEEGNERMSLLLSMLLLYRAGYIVGKYVSIEKLIENTKESYYECLHLSSAKWHENENDYEPFVKYMLGIIVTAYRDFSPNMSLLTADNLSKPERIREIIKTTLGEITKTDILRKCPDISQVTVQRTLADLVGSGQVIKVGGGRYTKYTWNN